MQPDGSFVINGLPPGTYVVRATAATDEGIEAVATVTVGGSDVAGVQLVGVRPSTVSGRIVFESGRTPPATQALRVSLMRPDPEPFGTASVRPHDDLTFQIKAAQGRGVLTAFVVTAPVNNPSPFSPPPGEWRVKRVVFNGYDITDQDSTCLPTRPSRH